MTGLDVVLACARNAEFVSNWTRLRGVHLPATPLDRLIDEASGNDSGIARLFIADVFDVVIGRMPEGATHG
jgi:hypothetical protein